MAFPAASPGSITGASSGSKGLLITEQGDLISVGAIKKVLLPTTTDLTFSLIDGTVVTYTYASIDAAIIAYNRVILAIAAIANVMDLRIRTPIVTSITPNSGTHLGGVNVAIVGTGFLTGASISIGGVACTNVVVVDDRNITATTPAGAAGAQNVVYLDDTGLTSTLVASYTNT